MSSNNPFNNVKAGVETVVADAAKVGLAASTDVAKAKVDIAAAKVAVVGADNKAIAWVKANPAKVVLIVVALVAILVWRLI